MAIFAALALVVQRSAAADTKPVGHELTFSSAVDLAPNFVAAPPSKNPAPGTITVPPVKPRPALFFADERAAISGGGRAKTPTPRPARVNRQPAVRLVGIVELRI